MYTQHKTSPGNNRFQDYIEKRLTDLHYNGCPSMDGTRKRVFSFIVSIMFMAFIPFLHFAVIYKLIWVPDKAPVDRTGCTCSCFDTVFRGAYENPGVVLYKHIYFNSTPQTFKVWILTLFFVLITYESVKYLYNLFEPRLHIRWSMFGLYLINIYPHYYSWWSIFNYFNEDFYTYFYHHIYFMLTEMIVTWFVLNMCDTRKPMTHWKLFVIICISMIHILLSGMDQFLSHVVFAHGKSFQNIRNIALMIPDLTHLFVSFWKLYKLHKSSEVPLSENGCKEELGLAFVFISLGTFIGKLL